MPIKCCKGCDNYKDCVDKDNCYTKLKSDSICCTNCKNYRSCERVENERKENIRALAHLFFLKLKGEAPSKIIFLIGAGTSASSGVPTAREVKKNILQLIEKSNANKVLEKIKNKYSYIDRFSRLKDIYDEIVPLEMICTAADDISNTPIVRTHLKQFFPSIDDNVSPSIGVECLAHLMNYNLINSVISLNFDELLEKALEDEVGEDGYFQAVSLEDFQRISVKIPEKPIILKPHGTVSVDESMRFNFEQVERLPYIIHETLRAVLRDPMALPIFAGYRCNDLDMERLFQEIASPHKKLYCIVRYSTNVYKSGIYENLRRCNSLEKVIPCQEFDLFCEELLNTLNEIIEKEKNIKGYHRITRHKIRQLVFKNMMSDSIENRFVLETVIYGLKARGAFYTQNLTDCKKVRNYLSKMRRKNISAKQFMDKLEKYFLLEQHDFSDTGLVEIEDNIEAIMDKFKDIFEGFSGFGVHKETLAKYLRELEDTFDIDISQPSEHSRLIFHSPHPLKNLMQLIDETRNILQFPGPLKCITEGGEWLLRQEYQGLIDKGREVRIIVALPQTKRDSKFEFKEKHRLSLLEKELGINAENIRCLDAASHNEHMTIGGKKGIYFLRSAKSTSISPMLLSDQRDLDILNHRFEKAWEEAFSLEHFSERRYFWEGFYNSDVVIVVGTRESEPTEGDKRRPLRRRSVGVKDFKAGLQLMKFLSKLNPKIRIQVICSEKEFNMCKEDRHKSYILLGAPDINVFAGSFWGKIKGLERWEDREPVKCGFIFGESKHKMQTQGILNAFYEPIEAEDKIGIIDYDESSERIGFWEYKEGEKDLGIIVRALNPFDSRRDSLCLIICGFSGFGTEGSLRMLIDSEEEVKRINDKGVEELEAVIEVGVDQDKVKDYKLSSAIRAPMRL